MAKDIKDIKEELWDGSYRVFELVRHDGVKYKLKRPVEYRTKLQTFGHENVPDRWSVTINNKYFDFYTGIGLRRFGKPVTPELSSVLCSLVLDSEASSMSFNSWCDEFGYSNDSIKARSLYDKCQMNSDELTKAKVWIDDEMREFFSEF